MGTAVKVRDLSTGWHGEAALYRVDPPLEDGTDLVVASAVDLPIVIPSYRTSETMVFPATDDGEAKDWAEIGFVGYKSHADALADAGYTLT